MEHLLCHVYVKYKNLLFVFRVHAKIRFPRFIVVIINNPGKTGQKHRTPMKFKMESPLSNGKIKSSCTSNEWIRIPG